MSITSGRLTDEQISEVIEYQERLYCEGGNGVCPCRVTQALKQLTAELHALESKNLSMTIPGVER